jgi:hypothetical protein
VQAYSLDRFFDALKAVANAAGLSRQLDTFFAALRANGGSAGLPGIDAQKPWGAYAHYPQGASDPWIVGLVPVREEAEFLNLLASLHCPADRDRTGLFVVQSRQLPAPVRFRFAHGYAYGTFGDPAALDDGKRIAPGRLFARPISGDVVATARADRLPAPLRDAIRRQVDGAALQMQRQVAGASAAQQAWARRFAESASSFTRDVFDGRAELTLRLGVDHAAREFVADLHLRGVSGSRLDRTLAALRPGMSRFGGVIAGDPALAALVHVQLPDDYSRLLAQLGRQATERVLRDAGPNRWNEHDRLFKLLEDVLRAGELDAAVAVRGHGAGRPGSIFGLKVPDGAALDDLFRALVAKDLAPEDRARMKLNADDLPGAKVHRYEWGALARGMPDFAPMLSGGPNLIGFSKDALWLAGGTKGRDMIRDALQDRSGPTPIFHFEMNAKALAELVPSRVARLDDVRATLTDEHPGRVRLTLEGGADLRLRGSLDLALLGLAARLVNLRVQLEARPAQR